MVSINDFLSNRKFFVTLENVFSDAGYNIELSSLCEWFIDNKLSIHFGDDEKPTKTKHIICRLLSETAQYCRISWMLP